MEHSGNAVRMKCIGLDEFKAAAGKFRVVVIIDSDVYQVNDDQDSEGQAIDLAHLAAGGRDVPVQIFNDQGAGLLHR